MEQNLRGLFEQALDDDPEPPPGDAVRDAMTRGRRIRRRRGLVVGGSVFAVVAGVVVALNVLMAPTASPDRVSPAAMMLEPAKPACTWPAQRDVSDVSIFLTPTVTDSQKAALEGELRGDPDVRGLRFESRAEAYAKFVALWRDNPDFVNSVEPSALPESFRMGLSAPDAYPSLLERFRGHAGVQDIVGRDCPGETE